MLNWRSHVNTLSHSIVTGEHKRTTIMKGIGQRYCFVFLFTECKPLVTKPSSQVDQWKDWKFLKMSVNLFYLIFFLLLIYFLKCFDVDCILDCTSQASLCCCHLEKCHFHQGTILKHSKSWYTFLFPLIFCLLVTTPGKMYYHYVIIVTSDL